MESSLRIQIEPENLSNTITCLEYPEFIDKSDDINKILIDTVFSLFLAACLTIFSGTMIVNSCTNRYLTALIVLK